MGAQAARPVPAALAFNALALLLHWQYIVNTASSNGPFHYGVHTVIVLSAFLLWIPVCGPLPELRITPPAQMLYLFITSIVPTVPARVARVRRGRRLPRLRHPQRMFDISVTTDQQVAGAIMKLGAGTYLWVLITVIFFRWSMRNQEADRQAALARRREVLTFDRVAAEFEKHPPPAPSARQQVPPG